MITKAIISIGLFIIMTGVILTSLNSEDNIPVVYAVPNANNTTITLESPVPPYSYLQDGFLKVEISNKSPMYPGFGKGLSKDTIYVFEKVFKIENNVSETGEAEICVTIVSNSENIGLFEGSFEGSWKQDISVSLLANETVYIGMRVDTHNLTLGNYESAISIQAVGGSCG
ncbi:DUF1102 domain-containing protein [Thermococcus sp.]